MLRVSRIYSPATGTRKREDQLMENAAFAGELAGNTELEELYRLDASEAETPRNPTWSRTDDLCGRARAYGNAAVRTRLRRYAR